MTPMDQCSQELYYLTNSYIRQGDWLGSRLKICVPRTSLHSSSFLPCRQSIEHMVATSQHLSQPRRWHWRPSTQWRIGLEFLARNPCGAPECKHLSQPRRWHWRPSTQWRIGLEFLARNPCGAPECKATAPAAAAAADRRHEEWTPTRVLYANFRVVNTNILIAAINRDPN
jgi:hypothetical protein